MDWLGLKGLATDIGLEKDALHIYAAFAIQLAVAFWSKRGLASWLPWSAVLLAVAVNEYLDTFHGGEIPLQEWQIRGSIHDLINTMALPSALLILARVAPAWLIRGREAPAPTEGQAPEGG